MDEFAKYKLTLKKFGNFLLLRALYFTWQYFTTKYTSQNPVYDEILYHPNATNFIFEIIYLSIIIITQIWC